jgi:hypothetical protein
VFESKLNKGVANGYVPLDGGTKIPSEFLNLPVQSVLNTGSSLYSNIPYTTDVPTNNGIFFGDMAGQHASESDYGVFIGYNAGYSSSACFDNIYLGKSAGYKAQTSSDSVFIGLQAGYNANNSGVAVFIGQYAGYQAQDAYGSNFIGIETGYQTTGAANSNFIGNFTGFGASNAINSNFLGPSVGYASTNAINSNFFGNSSGYQSLNANNSNFIGTFAGSYTSNASYSTLIGFSAGNNANNTNGIGSNNIIIGTNITLPDDTTNGINIGGILFGSGSHFDVNDLPYTGTTNGSIGINVVNPQATLDVSGSFNLSGNQTIGGILGVTSTTEKIYSFTGATGVIDHDFTAANIFYHTSISNNFTPNIINLPTTDSQSIGINIILIQGNTPYMINGVEIGGVSQNINWFGGTPESGNANKIDIVGLSFIRINSSWVVLGQLTTFG